MAVIVYVILPIIPLIFIFNKLTINSINMDVTTTMLVFMVIARVAEISPFLLLPRALLFSFLAEL